ncbi:hypothetical protein MIND_00889100 [Mycena indigotica]|uniref:Uncharacterized protein n=1 Tax=Mycena indigotica TaxID=2126181 RepID=A0A8H6SKB3_9AGAR|nr:uncharacterized protein MIND_00889100 [Mycena indigotica]KAF7299395.1 hypothetical protein MIND_00889100 [Mycena indigotica]
MEIVSPSTRSKLDALTTRYPQIKSLDVAAEFLSVLLADAFLQASVPEDEGLTAVTTCRDILSAKPKLYSQMQCARLADNSNVQFAAIASSPLAPALVSSACRRILDEVSRNIGTSGPLDLWEPRKHTDYKDESILTFLESLRLSHRYNTLSIILHDLGGFSNDPILSARVSEIFSPTNKFLVNASGTGKTRLCYEGLCTKWGFYLCVHNDEGRLGSYDLEKKLRGCREDFMLNTKSGEYHRNIERLVVLFRAILLARLLIFLVFLEAEEVAELQGSHDHLKKRWLTMQLNPMNINGPPVITDPFERLAYHLVKHDSSCLSKNIAIALDKIYRVIGEPLFLVVDEASYAIRMYSRELNGACLLQILLAEWKESTGKHCIIICAGIKIPQERFKDGAGSDFDWTSDTGGFDDPVQQERYVAQFLPPSLRDSPAGHFLVTRTWRWLRGRHRLTATFMAILLSEGLSQPHKRLDGYIEHAISFRPVDAVDFLEAEGDAPSWPGGFHPIKASDMLEEEKDLFRKILFRYLATHQTSPALAIDQVALMYYDWARFGDTRMTKIVLDEPMPLLGIARTLFPYPTEPRPGEPNENPATFIRSLCRNIPQTSESLAHCLVFYLTQALGKGKRLNQIFSSLSGPLEWTQQPAELVRFYRTDSDKVAWSPVARGDFQSFRPLAYQATSVEDTLAWMEHRVGTAFCLPHSSNVDLVFVIRMADGDFVWVILKAVVNEEPIQPSNLGAMLSSLQPNALLQEVDDVNQVRLQRAYDSLPKTGGCKILRALCAFPVEILVFEAGQTPGFDQGLETTDVAIINISALESRSYQVMQLSFFDAIVAGVLAGNKRKSRWENDDEKTLRTSRKRLKLEYLNGREQRLLIWPQVWWDGPIVPEPEDLEELEATRTQARRQPMRRDKGKNKKTKGSTEERTRIDGAYKLSAKNTKTTHSKRSRPPTDQTVAPRGRSRRTTADVDGTSEPSAESSKNPRTKRKAPPVDEPEVVTIDLDKTPAQNTRSRSKKV